MNDSPRRMEIWADGPTDEHGWAVWASSPGDEPVCVAFGTTLEAAMAARRLLTDRSDGAL